MLKIKQKNLKTLMFSPSNFFTILKHDHIMSGLEYIYIITSKKDILRISSVCVRVCTDLIAIQNVQS
jgi:hypothetical protein